MTLLGYGHKSTEKQQEIREARRLLKEQIRNDWDYPPLPAYRAPSRPGQEENDNQPDDEPTVAGFRFSPGRRGEGVDGPVSEVQGWRSWEYSTESDLDDEDELQSPTSTGGAKSMYKFEGPDSVGVHISDRRLARRRKRQKILEEEMIWNDGLAHWVRRRDAWCGARTVTQVKGLENQDHQPEDGEAELSNSDSATSSLRSSVSSKTQHSAREPTSAVTTPDLVPPTGQPAPPPPPPPPATATASSAVAPPRSELLIPVMATILPDHPVRRRITPMMYAEIYSKIIIQSRTPSIPINLLTLVSALVQGWKDDGEWPPKATAPEPSVGKRRQARGGSNASESSFRHGVKAFGRVLRLTSSNETRDVG